MDKTMYISADEISTITGLNIRTVLKLMRRGEIRHTRFVEDNPKTWRVKQEDFDEYLKNKTVGNSGNPQETRRRRRRKKDEFFSFKQLAKAK
jgi:excisionase family DNA binding protein